MYVSFIKHEIYIERHDGKVVWLPLIESGEEGTVIVFLIFWVAINSKCPHIESDTYKENYDGKTQDQYEGNL
jgi:hypothetical protein